jgi:hypothetical protein
LIYCVVPQELAEQLFDKLTAYYAADDNVTVIVDRRRGDRRVRGVAGGGEHVRTVRDRRRRSAADRLPHAPLEPIDGIV